MREKNKVSPDNSKIVCMELSDFHRWIASSSGVREKIGDSP